MPGIAAMHRDKRPDHNSHKFRCATFPGSNSSHSGPNTPLKMNRTASFLTCRAISSDLIAGTGGGEDWRKCRRFPATQCIRLVRQCHLPSPRLRGQHRGWSRGGVQ